jgi:ketosteroid isomerase-like protein
LALLAGCAGCNSTTGADTKAKDEADIRALEGRFVAGFKAKDVNAIMACYVPDESLIVFDVAPPRQYTGAPAYKKDWEGYLAAFPGPWDVTVTDLDVAVGGDVGYGRSIQRASFVDKDGKKSEMTVRVTDGYKKVNGQWLISHEHVSVPVDLAVLKPDLDSK